MKRPGAGSLIWLAIILAGVSIGIASIPLPRRLAGESGLPQPAPLGQPGEPAAAVSIDPILELSPFGRLIHATTAGSEAQETSLGLILHGVVIAARPEESSAIVSGPADRARVYRVGEDITTSASLDAVFGDHVVLQVGERSETLSFPKPEAVETTGDAATDSGVDALRALTTGDGEASGDDADSEPAPSDEPAEPDELDDAGGDIVAAIERYRSAIRDDPQAVLDDLGLVASDDGYRVDADASEALLVAGLLPGDVVSKVNGQQVGDIEADRQYFDDVTASGRARIEVARDGQRFVLSFPLR